MSTTKTEEIVNAACKNDCYEIIYHEFDYARETASQAMEDRHKMVNFYLILTGAVLAGVINLLTVESNFFNDFEIHIFAGILMALLFIAGVIYVAKLIFLRAAWYESALTMNQIKDFFKEMYPEINPALRWSTKSLKDKVKIDGLCTVFFLSTLLVILLDSLSITFACYLFSVTSFWLLLAFGLTSFFAQVFFFKIYLKRKK